jgi:hypothetical protein
MAKLDLGSWSDLVCDDNRVTLAPIGLFAAIAPTRPFHPSRGDQNLLCIGYFS